MIWAQGFALFALWLVAGWALRKRSNNLRNWLKGKPRRFKMMLGTVGMLGSGFFLLGGLYALAALGLFKGDSFTVPGFALAALIGGVFVALQTVCAGAMILIVEENETARRSASSVKSGKE